MPTTRKKQIKTVYKDEESEGEGGDFSDSGSEAKISDASSSEEEEIEDDDKSSGDDFHKTKNPIKVRKVVNKPPIQRRVKFAKDLVNKINKQVVNEGDEDDLATIQFSVKDLTEADKLLPSFLDLSESDSSDDESQTLPTKKKAALTSIQEHDSDNDSNKNEYQDVWSSNMQDNSEDIARKTFMELEKHTSEIEQTKATIENYVSKNQIQNVSTATVGQFNVNDLLAQGEEVIDKKNPTKKKVKSRKCRDNSDSEVEDWEEVNEVKSIPQQGLQLFVEFPDACKRNKKVDYEMMMKRKLNRVKKEYQVYMHKVHVLCWLGHGNYVSCVLNDQEIMTAALAMVPKGCYPEDRVTTKYVEQIVTWFKDKLTLRQDKHEHKFRPKAPPLKTTILTQMKSRVTTAKKYNIFIFVAMLRALGLQCRVMFNFVTLPIRPPSSELCSLSTKPKDEGNKAAEKSTEKITKKTTKSKLTTKCTKKIAQIDGIDDTLLDSDSDTLLDSDSEFENIMQLDGSNDTQPKTRSTRSTRTKKVDTNNHNAENDGVSPPKRAKPDLKAKNVSDSTKKDNLAAGEDNPPEVPKSPVRKRSVRNKTTTKTENSKSLAKEDNSKDIADENKDKLVKPPNSLLQRTARNKTANDDTLVKDDKATINITDSTDKTNKAPKTSARNKDTSKNASVGIKTETSKSPQSKTNNKELDSSKTSLSITKGTKDIFNKTVVKNVEVISPRKTRSERRTSANIDKTKINAAKMKLPSITVTDENSKNVESKFFSDKEPTKQTNLSRKRSHTTINVTEKTNDESKMKPKTRTKSAPGTSVEKSKYFDNEPSVAKKSKKNEPKKQTKKEEIQENKLRISHRELTHKMKSKNDVTEDLVDIIKGRIKVEKAEAKKGIVKGKVKDDSDDDSDFLPVEDVKSRDSDDDFKPTKISPRPNKIVAKSRTSKKLDRRVLSSDDDVVKNNKTDVWCEVFVEELEQWVAVDVINGKVHCTCDLYTHATHPLCYVVGWDNNNYLKDLTRRYVPHWNTVTRKQRAEPGWWRNALQPWLGPKTARDREEDEYLDRMQLEAPLPKSIAEYKNHPLYALKRHLLKFEALYPPDAGTLGFVRGEAVYPRDCVYTCQSRDKWLKEAKTVRLGEKPYKVVKARPKWDKLSNKCITDKPLEVFGPWQVQDYEPPTAENGIVPRNAYGNVELFKDCMLPKKTVHIKLPGLNKVAKKLNIDCAPAMTGFDFNGGFSHPVYDGFVVCEEFEELITAAWITDQEDQERREREKVELRVYGNWKHIIRALMIRERLKHKYGFQEPSTSQAKPKSKGPRLVVKKK